MLEFIFGVIFLAILIVLSPFILAAFVVSVLIILATGVFLYVIVLLFMGEPLPEWLNDGLSLVLGFGAIVFLLTVLAGAAVDWIHTGQPSALARRISDRVPSGVKEGVRKWVGIVILTFIIWFLLLIPLAVIGFSEEGLGAAISWALLPIIFLVLANYPDLVARFPKVFKGISAEKEVDDD
jgi:hypothetical protein